jgi:hypothetical protein
MEMARTSEHSKAKSYYQHRLEGTTPPPASGAVNLALINTSPQQLAEMAKAKFDLDDHSGPSAAQCNGTGLVALQLRRSNREQPPTVVQSPGAKKRLAIARQLDHRAKHA